MKTLLICHDGAALSQQGLARWLASFSELVGIVVLRETRQRKLKRIKSEIQRVGLFRFVDVLAFRLYYKMFLNRKDKDWEKQELKRMFKLYPEIPKETPIIYTESPNTKEAEDFIKKYAPDIVLARCKTLIARRVYTIPKKGTFVMHAGICPEYRNAHGCFWALANNDLQKVGMTLLRIDKGIDTGPIYGYYTYDFDEVNESHVIIQFKVVHENLDLLKEKFEDIYLEQARVMFAFRGSTRLWGQPWLSKYLYWKCMAKKRKANRT